MSAEKTPPTETTETKELLDGIRSAFKSLQDTVKTQDERLAKAESDFAEKSALDKIHTDIEQMEDRLKKVSAKASRPDIETKAGPTQEEKSFGSKLRNKVMTPDDEKALRTNSDVDGGYLVPENMSSEVLRLVRELSPWFQLANVQRISTGNVFHQPRWNTQVAGSWTAENDALAETTGPQLANVSISAHEAQVNLWATRTMLADTNYGLESYLQMEAAEAYAALSQTAFTSGSGVGQPLGFENATGLNNVNTSEATLLGTNDAEIADNLLAVVYEGKSAYQAGASFMANKDTIRILRQIKDGDSRFYWEPSLIAGEPSRLLGFPIYENPFMDGPTSGTTYASGAKPLIFGDFRRGYTIVIRQDQGVLVDPYTGAPNVKYQWFWRVGGAVVQPEALTTLTCSA